MNDSSADFLSDELLLYDNGTSRPFAEDHHHHVNFYSINLLFSLNNMSLSLPSDLPDDYSYVSVGKGSFE